MSTSSYDYAMSGSFSEDLIHKFRELHELLRKNALSKRSTAGDFEFERLPHFLNSAFITAATLTASAREIALRLAPPDGQAMFVTGNALAFLYMNVEGFLSACVKAQNALYPYIRHTKSGLRSLPSSFRHLVNNVRRGKCSVDGWLRDAILDYWDKHGKKLRDYRDLAKHKCLIISNVRVVREANSDNVGLSMLLPANPDADNPHDLDFANNGTDALRYIARELLAITVLTDRVIRFVVDKYGGFHTHSVSPRGVFEFRPPIQIGPNARRPNLLPIPDKDELLPAITAAVEKARKESN